MNPQESRIICAVFGLLIFFAMLTLGYFAALVAVP